MKSVRTLWDGMLRHLALLVYRWSEEHLAASSHPSLEQPGNSLHPENGQTWSEHGQHSVPAASLAPAPEDQATMRGPLLSRRSPGPPAHWLERVRQGAPDFWTTLLADQSGQAPNDAAAWQERWSQAAGVAGEGAAPALVPLTAPTSQTRAPGAAVPSAHQGQGGRLLPAAAAARAPNLEGQTRPTARRPRGSALAGNRRSGQVKRPSGGQAHVEAAPPRPPAHAADAARVSDQAPGERGPGTRRPAAAALLQAAAARQAREAGSANGMAAPSAAAAPQEPLEQRQPRPIRVDERERDQATPRVPLEQRQPQTGRAPIWTRRLPGVARWSQATLRGRKRASAAAAAPEGTPRQPARSTGDLASAPRLVAEKRSPERARAFEAPASQSIPAPFNERFTAGTAAGRAGAERPIQTAAGQLPARADTAQSAERETRWSPSDVTAKTQARSSWQSAGRLPGEAGPSWVAPHYRLPAPVWEQEAEPAHPWPSFLEEPAQAALFDWPLLAQAWEQRERLDREQRGI
jgi:hypothetical protein